MTVLEKIREYAENKQLMFRDYRKDSFINGEPECRYELLYPNTFNSFAKFDTQEEISEFLALEDKKEKEKNKTVYAVLEENIGGDAWTNVVSSREEAIKEAEYAWDRLTENEKKIKRVSAIAVKWDYIEETLFTYEDGATLEEAVDSGSYTSYDDITVFQK